jgi:hypothetical protein
MANLKNVDRLVLGECPFSLTRAFSGRVRDAMFHSLFRYRTVSGR